MSWLLCKKDKKGKEEKTGLEKARALELITEKEFLKLTAERASAKFERYTDLEKLKGKKKKR